MRMVLGGISLGTTEDRSGGRAQYAASGGDLMAFERGDKKKRLKS